MKGQAFVVFKDLNAATSARHGLDNSLIFGKEMVIQIKNQIFIYYLLFLIFYFYFLYQKVTYSKNVSDCILKLSNNYNHKEKLKRDSERRRRRESK